MTRFNRGCFELVFESLGNSSDRLKYKINVSEYFRDIFLFQYKNVCCVNSLESPHRGDSIEYTQHTIVL